MYFFYPESNFRRPQVYEVAITNEEKVKSSTHLETTTEKGEAPLGVQHVDHVQISWVKVWTSFIRLDSTISTARAFVRPLLTLAYPSVLWAVVLYGTSLASQVILIFAFPSLLLAPPYQFAPSSVGLMQIAAIIGFLIACFGGGYISDHITARRIVRAEGSYFPEQRLVSLIPGAWIGSAGCIVVAFTCAYKLSWVGIAFGFGMCKS